MTIGDSGFALLPVATLSIKFSSRVAGSNPVFRTILLNKVQPPEARLTPTR